MIDLWPYFAAGVGMAAGLINALTWRQLGLGAGVQKGLERATNAHSSPIVKAAIGLDVMLPRELKEKISDTIRNPGDRGDRASSGPSEKELEKLRVQYRTEGYELGYRIGHEEGLFCREFEHSGPHGSAETIQRERAGERDGEAPQAEGEKSSS